jgi:hypothetical protein
MRGTTNEDLSHESWMEVCREVSYDTEGFEYPSEYDEDNDYDDDDYNGDDGHYDEDNPNIPEANPSSLWAKFLWRKLYAIMAVSALLERVKIRNATTKKKKKKARRFIDFSTPMKPTEDDILFGRGGDINKHPGNVHFRNMARDLAFKYVACGESKEEKYKVSVELVDCMKNRRFLKKEPDGLWYKVLGNGIRIKASQALRDVQTREG